MRKVIVSEFVSLDGVMEDPGGAEKSKHGGWTMPYWNEEIGKFKFDERNRCAIRAEVVPLGSKLEL